jgi:hypothetical protein
VNKIFIPRVESCFFSVAAVRRFCVFHDVITTPTEMPVSCSPAVGLLSQVHREARPNTNTHFNKCMKNRNKKNKPTQKR